MKSLNWILMSYSAKEHSKIYRLNCLNTYQTRRRTENDWRDITSRMYYW